MRNQAPFYARMLLGQRLALRQLAAIAVLTLPFTVGAQTLCAKGETDFFSCTLSDHRLLSVCGAVQDEPSAGDWLQFRRGRPGRVEMSWPSSRKDSVKAFEGNVFGPYSVSDLRFNTGDASYGLQVSRGGEDDGSGGRTRRGASLYVEREGHHDRIYRCLRPDIARYGRSFEELNARLFNERQAARPR